jgi:hypothetical protein
LRNIGSEFVLSTRKEGKLKGRLLVIAFGYLFIVALLIGFGVYFYIFYLQDLGFFSFIPYLLIIFGLLILIISMKDALQVETIKVDEYGLTIQKGKKLKTASWPDVVEVKNCKTIYPAGYSVLIRMIDEIVIRTITWNYKVSGRTFTRNDLKELFLNIAERVKDHHTNIVDTLGWLPNRIPFQGSKTAGQSIRLREYRILLKVGVGMFLIGATLFVFIFYLNLWNSSWFAVLVILLLFGSMCSVGGWFGIGEEKKKLENG